ncbi:GTP-binding protein EngB required for normal cell division [Microbacteriaceae bacterium SG_E_30_P1]|uniref:GTP-binding protein EngB required for normal cell division n=1 Tax=Antiquaquibacter oligotrophicus TaxID=2880260 RepID=A0ABT6KSY8_9MICO|nr:GTPase [Antiquaquibacter oligotrophicus]MDH6182312.1 GTP-binding protein EngB required for normal cell division [Antiquaquibacter oligotrophicus]UDF12033.1 dynamin family protein [Antiquaquibacter oligotrophicus]
MSGRTLDARLAALRELRALGDGRLQPELMKSLDALLDRAESRRSLSGDHTVVGLFGATGSGKSSLINALVGEEVATTHMRRPTTSEPLAVIWGVEGSAALLDWLDVRTRHPASGIFGGAEHLILLDLPDFDSIESHHRAIAERLAAQVDVLVWVVDPQKYADAVVHVDFLAPHARHGAVTLVVLNQIDRLAERDVPAVVASLTTLLDHDGVRAKVLTTSAVTGDGIPELRNAIAALAADRAAITARLEADVSSLADTIPAPQTTTPRPVASGDLVDQLAIAAGVDVVASAVAASYRKRTGQVTGWPIVSWLLRFRPDPLRRLGLRPNRGSDPELHRTSLPAMSAGSAARVSLAVRSYADAAAEPFTESWRAGIRLTAQQSLDTLPPELDLAVARAPLPSGASWWWVPFAVLQWLAIASALVGVGWIFARSALPMIVPAVPEVTGWPVTTLLILGGILLGILLGVAGAALGAVVGRFRRRLARRSVIAEVDRVATARVIEPIAAARERAAEFSAALAIARDTTSTTKSRGVLT